MLPHTLCGLIGAIVLGTASAMGSLETRGPKVEIMAAQSGIELSYDGQDFETDSLWIKKTPQSFWVKSKSQKAQVRMSILKSITLYSAAGAHHL